MVLENAIQRKQYQKKKTKTMSVLVQVDNIKETICHIMQSIKTQNKIYSFLLSLYSI